MCKQGIVETFTITNENGIERIIDVDSCVAPIVRALNDAGIITIASCCGHGKRPANVALADGREIFIVPNFETARKLDLLFPPLND